MNDQFTKYDIVELISEHKGQIQSKIFKDQETAERILKKYNADIRLDYHGVTDITKKDYMLLPKENRDKNKICVISYVGKFSDKRVSTRLDVIERIKTNQIDFGILIFKRCRDKDVCNVFHDVGSKAWINKLLSMNQHAIFIDDSEDHYYSVKSLRIPNLKSILFNGKDEDLVNLIQNEIGMKGGYYDKYMKYKSKYIQYKKLFS